MQIKPLAFAMMVSLYAAQISFALPAVEDAGDSLPSTAQVASANNNTLSATPVVASPPMVMDQVSQSVSQKSGAIDDRFLEKLNTLEQEVQSLQGQVDVLQHDLKQAKTDQAQQFLILNQKMAAAPAVAVVPPVAAKPTNTEPATKLPVKAAAVVAAPAAVTSPVSVSPAVAEDQDKKTYDAAYSLVSAHAYADAAEAFAGYLSIYGATGHYAGNANYWLGELSSSQQKYPEAIKYLEVVVSQYPKSSKAPDALLKLGVINKRLGNDVKSQEWFVRLLKDYPQSKPAQSAKEYTK